MRIPGTSFSDDQEQHFSNAALIELRRVYGTKPDPHTNEEVLDITIANTGDLESLYRVLRRIRHLGD